MKMGSLQDVGEGVSRIDGHSALSIEVLQGSGEGNRT